MLSSVALMKNADKKLMLLVDGVASARLIRAFGKENSPPCLQKAQSYGRIPIIAVSASLSEQAWSDYIDCGFDGWILKPIDFTRLEAILAAVENEQTRRALLYENDNWDMGGWFKLKWVGHVAKNVERPTSTTGTVALEGE
jgi:DNA-binding response OmpR family regulator